MEQAIWGFLLTEKQRVTAIPKTWGTPGDSGTCCGACV